MKKLSVLLLLCAWRAAADRLSVRRAGYRPRRPAACCISIGAAPETRDSVILIEGMEETVSLQKAMHENFYALYS